jgi:hypothetical protein
MNDASTKNSPGAPSIPAELAATLSAIRTNCHITDARHAADYTMCVYLLKMREYFRWEHAIPYSATLPHEELAEWLTGRESLWEKLSDAPYSEVPVAGRKVDPFDAGTINAHLNARGYVYSSGYGRNMKPHFFLGELIEQRSYNGFTLYISGREYARDLTAPPAMSLGDTIFIRHESLRRMIWEKVEEWRWNRPENAMRRAIDHYGFDTMPEQALDDMTRNEIQSVLLHEIGEVMAGEALGDDWEVILAELPHSKAEIMLRAVRDNLADTLSTLPGLLEELHPASMHFYMANLTNMRKLLFPSLLRAYEEWDSTGNPGKLSSIISQGREHWLDLARRIIHLCRNRGEQCQQEIVSLVEASAL